MEEACHVAPLLYPEGRLLKHTQEPLERHRHLLLNACQNEETQLLLVVHLAGLLQHASNLQMQPREAVTFACCFGMRHGLDPQSTPRLVLIWQSATTWHFKCVMIARFGCCTHTGSTVAQQRRKQLQQGL